MGKEALLALFLILGVVSCSIVSAQTFLNIYVDEAGESLFLGETSDSPVLPEGIEIKDGDIIGKTHALTTKQGEIWEFEYFLSGAELNIVLPKGTVIKHLEYGDVYLRNNQISIYNIGVVKVSYTIEEDSGISFWVFILAAMILITILLLLYFRYKARMDKKEKKPERKDDIEIIKQTLNDREKEIVGKLQEVGEIKHSRLQKLLNIPKASFSRHIQELDRKGIIKRDGEGKNKILSLR